MLIRRKLRALIKYNKETGRVITQYPITLQERGYAQIKINNKNYRLVNVLWILVNGELPEYGIVTHKNDCKIDFTYDNLELDTDKMLIRKYNAKLKAERLAKDNINTRQRATF